MSSIADLLAGLRAFRPFLPAKEFDTSLRFYEAIGFESFSLGESLCELRLGPYAFLLQNYYVKEWADNFMMHVLVADVDGWHRHMSSLQLRDRFGVPAPSPPRLEPWGLRVSYVTDPSGVLWHFAEPAAPDAKP